MTKSRTLLWLPLLAILSISLAACGGDDTEDLDPAGVLEATFSDDHDVSSGNLGLTLSADVPGEGGGDGNLSVTAPFNDRGEGEVPEVSLDVSLDAEFGVDSIDVTGGGALTGEGATINFNDSDYEVPEKLFEAFAEGITEATEESSAFDLGIDTESWFTNLTNEGSEDIDGTETVHISGDADVTEIATDLIEAAAQSGLPGSEDLEGSASQLGLLEGFIEEASFDVFSESDGNLLRRLDVTLNLENLAAISGGQGPDTASFELSVTLSDPNEEQTIELPTDLKPFDELESDFEAEFGDLFGLDALEGGAGKLPGAGGSGGAGGGGAGGGAGAGGTPELEDLEDIPGVDQDYLDCIEKAKSPEELIGCGEAG